mgnify:CR=1 FL=1
MYTSLPLTNVIKFFPSTSIPSKGEFFDLPKNDPLQRKPDITSVKNFFKWSPETTFNEGASKTIQYFEKIQKYENLVESVCACKSETI